MILVYKYIKLDDISSYKRYIEDLLEDYKLASLYFESNRLEAKKKDADNECSKLNDYLIYYNEGINIDISY